MIELREVVKIYRKPNQGEVRAIDHVSLEIQKGEFVAVLGPSGSGKSTLMNVMGLLDRPDSGEYRLNGTPVSGLGENELAHLRNEVIGFVFQAYHLLPRTTAIENVQLPLLYANTKDYVQRSKAALEAVGLADRLNHFTSELSGGQQQRVAIARAIVNKPSILLADEPTGNLDPVSSREIMDLFEEQTRRGTTVVLITHDQAVADRARRVIRIGSGAIQSDTRVEAAA
jgi:ABC-type lipoprotein export system ATPase subunit